MIRYYSIEYNSCEKTQKLVTKDPTIIPKLLCAARTQDEDTIRSILKSILQDGVAEEDINTFDCSGRTALSYMCSANLNQALEVLLQVPGIDINKSDIELNTPLHHAAECGNVGAIRLLLLQNKLEMDQKNVFGLTPLMKAAIQGHVRCAKTLLFAGASPLEVDYKRQLRADQWAKFCGRHSCAEQIEKWSETKNREDDVSMMFKKNNDKNIPGRPRANSVAPVSPKLTFGSFKNPNDGGLRSRISKVFNFVSRDKSQRNGAPPGSSSAKNSFSMPRGSFSMLSRSDGYLDAGSRQSVDIPKLEITSPHNQELIRKYEKRYSIFETTSTGKPPALPPRKHSMVNF